MKGADLPAYASHKRVRAAPIKRVEGNVLVLDLGEGDERTVQAEPAMFARYLPSPGDFYVVYPPTRTNPEPWASIAPADAFAEGYRQLGASDDLLSDAELARAIELLPGERVTEEAIRDRIADVYFHVLPGTTVTICSIALDNGFSVRGESATVDPRNFNEDIGRKLAHDDAFRKLWAFFGFILAESRYRRGV